MVNWCARCPPFVAIISDNHLQKCPVASLASLVQYAVKTSF